MAPAIREIAARCGVPVIFKASFDKANRTSRTSFRGPGLDAGLAALADVQGAHRPAAPHRHPRAGAGGAGRRGRRRAADPGVPVAADRSARGRRAHRQGGQHQEGPVPGAERHAARRSPRSRPKATQSVLVTERGVSFGYNNLVVDMRAFPMLRALGYPVVFDVTHSLQLPGAGDGVTAGLAEYIEPLASAGVAAGVDAVFMEVHEDPARAQERRRQRAAARPARGAHPEADADRRRRARGDARPQDARMTTTSPASTSRSRARCCRPRRPRSSRSSTASTSASSTPCGSCSSAAAASSSPAWASRASSAARSPRRSRAPARRPSSCTRPKPSTATSACCRPTTSCSRCRTAARPTSCCGCSRRSSGSARGSSPSPATPTSTLAQAADVALDCRVSEEACPLNLVPTASTTAALALGDALAMTLLVAKGFRQEDFANLHPGGKLGKRLMRVEQLMHAGDNAPVVAHRRRRCPTSSTRCRARGSA